MADFFDLNNDSHNQDNEILFGRISSDLFKKGYSVNVNALPIKLADQLFQNVSAMTERSFEDAAIGRDQAHLHDALVRSQKQSWIYTGDSVASTSWLKWTGELQSYLNQHLYLGLFSFESHYAHYCVDDFYKRHYDAFKGQSGRKISIVVYLNREWLSSDDGELVLYLDDADKMGLRVMPSFATVVVFLSEEHPHEVLPARRDRYSIAGWFSPNTASLLN